MDAFESETTNRAAVVTPAPPSLIETPATESVGSVVTGGVTGAVPAAVSTKELGTPVPAPAVNPTPCTAPMGSDLSHSMPLITYCEPVWLTICAFQMVSIVRA